VYFFFLAPLYVRDPAGRYLGGHHRCQQMMKSVRDDLTSSYRRLPCGYPRKLVPVWAVVVERHRYLPGYYDGLSLVPSRNEPFFLASRQRTYPACISLSNPNPNPRPQLFEVWGEFNSCLNRIAPCLLATSVYMGSVCDASLERFYTFFFLVRKAPCQLPTVHRIKPTH
jgi:hypothetical protein